MPAGLLATTHSSSLWKTASSATGVAGASKAARSSPPLSHLPNLHLQNAKLANLWERSDVFASFSKGSHRFASSRRRARPAFPVPSHPRSQNSEKIDLPTPQSLSGFGGGRLATASCEPQAVMDNKLPSPHDEVPDPLVTPDGLSSDAAPTDNTPADPSDQPLDAAPPEAPGTPDAISESGLQSGDTPADSSSSDSQSSNASDVPVAGTPEAPAPPSTHTPQSKQPRAKRPNHPDRDHKLLKGDRSGIGGPATPEGKAVSCLNNLKHGMYSRLPFYLLPHESQQEYDALLDRLRTLYPPIDESTAQMLELHVQAFYRLGRCNHAEYLAESADRTNFEKFQRGVTAVGMHRTRCERSYYLHLDKLKQLLADYKKEQEEILENMQDEELETLEEEAK